VLNRETSKAAPAAGTQPAYTGYDLAERELSVLFASTGQGVTYAAGRLTCLAQNCAAIPPTGMAYTFAYSPAGQALTAATTTDVPAWISSPQLSLAKTYDGLNRDAAIATISNAACGHFGRTAEADGGFSRERTDLADELKRAF